MGNANSGRRPNPNSLRILKGEKNKNRYNFNEPKPPAGEVRKPGTLSVEAAGIWDESAGLFMEMGTLTVADVSAFAVYCELQASFRSVIRLKETGKFSVATEIALANALRPYFDYFGMHVLARAKISLPPKSDQIASKWAGLK